MDEPIEVKQFCPNGSWTKLIENFSSSGDKLSKQVCFSKSDELSNEIEFIGTRRCRHKSTLSKLSVNKKYNLSGLDIIKLKLKVQKFR